MATRQDANVPLLAVIGAVSVLLILIIVIGVEAWFLSEQNAEIARKFDNTPVTWLQELKTEQQAKLETTRWVDRGKGIVQIPIEEAMKLIVKDDGKLPQ